MLPLLLLLAACGTDTTVGKTVIDADSDGYDASVDCDDAHAAVNPDAPEVCDGIDQDCDGEVDEDATDATTWFADADGDAYGDPDVTTVACDAPAGAVEVAGDCDDAHSAAYPGGTEVCDGLDNDCDGSVDEDATDGSTWHQDLDGDGYGDAAVAADGCEAPAGFVADASDCDDARSDIHPGAPETDCADPTDYNCDGSVAYDDLDGDGFPACEDCDDADASVGDTRTWYRDVDEDGYASDSGDSVVQCAPPSGYAGALGDCDDYAASVNPGAAEVCDDYATDEDCDGLADDADPSTDSATWTTWYDDRDGDTYGDPIRSARQCAAPSGYVADGTDCDDGALDVHPAAAEVCNGVDDDCDGLVDDADSGVTGQDTWYADADGDGYGDGAPVLACTAPAGHTAVAGDCDDGDASAHPGATEVCDAANTDEDCDGAADDAGAAGTTTWYLDGDADTYGGATAISACDAPSGYVARTGDCADAEAGVNPDATEVCNGSDDDCDGLIDAADPSMDGLATWYRDADADGYGGSTSVSACTAPAGYVATSTDCNDANGAVHPGAAEVCDAANVDEDCDGVADDADASVSGRSTWYGDADADSYGSAASTTAACDVPAGYVATGTDCDDRAAAVHPGATEVCDAADTDEDCDGSADDASAVGTATWYLDGDADSYGGSTAVTACDAPSGYVARTGDCADAVVAVNPGATEVCNGTDDDCDGLTDGADPSVAGLSTWYRDADADGYGGSTSVTACSAPAGYVATSTDCNDANAAAHPGVAEVCDAGNIDEDCDGAADDADASVSGRSTWYRDADADSYGSPTVTTAACDVPAGYVATGTDCDDTRASVHPLGAEVCDAANLDEDCDGLSDDADGSVSGRTTWYRDADSDAYGTSATTTAACDVPSGYVATAGDCNDADAGISPGDPEVCDAANVDEDCDGAADDSDSAATGKTAWYADADSDTYGAATTSTSACDRPSAYVSTSSDCDDANAAVHPGATEVCDIANVDEDCDSLADDADPGATGKSTWYADADADGYGAAPSTSACDAPSGYLATATDCDDAHADAHPGGTETCDDGIDQDCSGADLSCADAPFSGDYAVDESYQTKIYGTYDGDQLGYALAAGDFNGDGRGDLVANARYGEVSSSSYVNYGIVAAYYGPQTAGVYSTFNHYGVFYYSLDSAYAGTFGTTLASVGDINSDGRDDLFALRNTSSGYLLYGGDGGGYIASSVADYTPACSLAVAAGDEDAATGADEWLCANVTSGSYMGRVWIVQGLGSALPATFYGESTYDYLGYAMAGATDLDGDGLDDIVLGAYGDDDVASDSGAAYVLYAPITGTFSLTGADAKLRGSGTDEQVGAGVKMPGDLDGDGYADLLVGAPGSDGGGLADAGAVFAYTSMPSGSVSASSTATYILYGEDAGDRIGAVMDSGDVNGDGEIDLLVGSPANDDSGTNAGAAWLVLGPTSGTTSLASADACWLGTAASDLLGFSLAVIPDTDGDGDDEIALGAPVGDERGYVDRGTVYVYNGR